MIELNRNPAGKMSNIIFGLGEVVDGLIRVASLGFLHTTITVSISRWQAKSHINRLKNRRHGATRAL